MYESFYGLKAKPFELHPDPDYLYMSPGHDDVYTHLHYSAVECKGFVVITGEIGSGKTTLINFLLRRIPQHVTLAVINNTTVQPDQFLKMLSQELKLRPKKANKLGILAAFNEFLLQEQISERRVILVLDEAQNLPLPTIEEIRLLSNLESEKRPLLQIVMVGQPELREKLRQQRLQQFLQRVTVHCHLGNLSREDVKGYIRHRLSVADAGDREIFDDTAIDAVCLYSGGNPRIINVLCDTALVYGMVEKKATIDRNVVEEVVEARRLGGLFLGHGEALRQNRSAELHQTEGDPLEEVEERIRALKQRVRELERFNEDLRGENESLNIANRQIMRVLKRMKRRIEGQNGTKPVRAPEPEPVASRGVEELSLDERGFLDGEEVQLRRCV